MILRANCKINLGLDILRKREDGFHDLETVMIPVPELYDIIEISQTSTQDVTFHSEGLIIDCPPEENICIKAFQLMHNRYGIAGVAIRLIKQVPFGAGLGGGSSDATTIIKAIDTLFELHLSEAELIDCAAALGSDTAFFVRNTPQLCTGRGEIMVPFNINLSGLNLVLIKPDDGVSTREAYAGVQPHIPPIPLAQRLQFPITAWQNLITNDFEPHIFAAHPAIRNAKEQLLSAGALYASMSGSGSTVFGLFDDLQKASAIATPYIYKL